MTSHIAKATKGDESMECLTPNRSICRACGQDGIWCSVYTSCPLNRGNEHSMKRVCLRLKRHGRVIQMTHCFVYDGPGDGRHCVYCADVEVLQENPNQGS